MKEKRLGKINFAEFGMMKDYPFLVGLQLGFSMNNTEVMDGGEYTVNLSPSCNWKEKNREEIITRSVEAVERILKDAKVSYVSQLIGKPVEVTIEDNCFHDFRILTEVL